MAWNTAQVLTALTAQLRATAPDTTEIVRHLEVSPSTGAPGSGVAHADTRLHTSGVSNPGSSSLVLQELVELHQSLNTNESSVAIVDSGDWWWGVFELSGVPTGAADVNLRWLESSGATPTQTATRSVTPGADEEATARAILTQLETIPHATDADLYAVNGRGAFFYAWVTQGGDSNRWSVVLVASSHRQRYARILTALTNVTAAYTYGQSEGELLVSRIADPSSPWDEAMTEGDIVAKPQTNAQGGTSEVIPTREDVYLQGMPIRAATAAKMRSEDKVLHGEIIAPAVPRTVVIPIDYTDFASATGTITRRIDLPWPFDDRLGFAYYSEGTPLITDAFIELGTAWQVASGSAQAGTYPSVTMDIGVSAPVLPDSGTNGRMATSAILRGVRLTENATQGFNLGGGYAPVNQVYAPSGEKYHGGAGANHSGNATEWINWAETDQYLQAAVPYIDASEPTMVQLLVFEPVEAYTPDESNYTTFKLYVCPPNVAPSSGNFVTLDTYFDVTAAPYNLPTNRWSATGVYTPQATLAGQPRTQYLPLLLPRGWKLAVEQIQTGHGGLGDTRNWRVRVLTSAHRGRGVLLNTPSSTPTPDPFSDRKDTLTCTINLEAKTELQVGGGVTEPAETTYNLASLDQGKCYLHVRFWQPRRVGSQRSYSTEG